MAIANTPRKILVTSALPYANGSIHLGNLVEYIQTDIWVRFQKMQGHTVYYVCADDTHGTPIMLRAEKEGVTPEALIDGVHKEHTADFNEFLVEFDNYYSTNAPENKELSQSIYKKLKAILSEEIPYYPLVYKTYGVITSKSFQGEVKPMFNNIYNGAESWSYLYEENNL